MLGIRARLVLTSTLVISVLIGAFGWGISMQARRLIDQSAELIQARTRESLQRSGDSTLGAIVESTRIALAQNDFATIQETLQNLARRDKRVLAMAVVDRQGRILAHNDPSRVGKPASAGQALFAGKAAPRALTFKRTVEYEGKKLATAQLAFSLAQLDADNRKTAELKKREIKSTLTKTLTVGLLAMLLGFALSIIQAIRIVGPITEVARKADQIASGDLMARVTVRSRDELGLLADRFNYMAQQVTVLLEHAQQKAFLEQELELASAVQSTLLPSASTIQRPGLSIAGHFQPASRCAGDWWGVYELSSDRTLLLVGDVTGHGVAAAMITAAAKGAASAIVAASEGDCTLTAVLDAMNVAIYEASRAQFVMTCFAAIYDPATRTLHYANAGHNFPLHHDDETRAVGSLVARGNRLGDVLGSVFEVKSCAIGKDATVVLFTDGLTECRDAQGREFGIRRLRQVLKTHAQAHPAALRDEIMAEATRFATDVARHDDVTLIVGRFS